MGLGWGGGQGGGGGRGERAATTHTVVVNYGVFLPLCTTCLVLTAFHVLCEHAQKLLFTAFLPTVQPYGDGDDDKDDGGNS